MKYIAPRIALSLVFTFCMFSVVSAQPWTYDFGTSTGTHASNAVSETFLPAAPAGSDRVRVGGAGGSWNMENQAIAFGSGSYLRGAAPTSASVNKFSVYDYTAGKSFALKFDVRFGNSAGANTATSGTWNLFIGDGVIYSDNNAFTGTQVFTGLQFVYGASGAITTSYRNASSWTAVSGTPFAQASSYSVEIYGNNTTGTLNYVRGTSQTVAANKFDLWVNGSLIGNDLAKGQLANDATIDSWMFYGESSSGNVANIFLDNFDYSNTLPSAAVAPTLTTPTATSITNNSAVLGATVTANGGATLTARGTVYKTSATVTAADNALAEGGTSVAAFSHSRTSLSPQTQYYYAGYATNSAGTALSSEASFRTLSDPVTVQAASLNATQASTTQIDLDFTGATFPSSGATKGGYVVIYSTGTPTLSSTNGHAPAAGAGSIFATSSSTLPTTPSTNIQVTGLTHSTSYNFLVVPYTWDGVNAATYNYFTAGAPTASASTMAGPKINITATPADFVFGNVVTGTTSTEASYTVSGSNLTGDITINAPAGFELSTSSGGTFQSALTLTHAGGTVNNTTIYVIYKPGSANGAASGNITHTSTDATNENIAVTGNALAAEPTIQSSITFGTRTTTTLTVNFSGGNGAKRILVARASSAVSYSPTDAATPTGVSNVFTTATDKGSGNKIVYNGTGSTVTITGLTINTTYHFAVYEYNEGSGTSQNFYTSSPGTANQFTLDDATYALDNLGTDITEDFNDLATSGTSSTMPSGWFFTESGSGANTTYTSGTGSSATGDTYSFGSNTDRALGSLQSGSVASSLGTKLINASGETLTSLVVSYTGEQWRLGATGRVDKLVFAYSTNATSLTTGTWTPVTALDFTAPVNSGSTGALNGNLAANRTDISAVITGLSIANAGSIWLRWTDFDASGSDDGLGIDDVTITPFSTTRLTGNTNLATGTYGNLNVINNTTLTGDVTVTGKINLKTGTMILLNGNRFSVNGTVTDTLPLSADSLSELEIAGSGNLPAISFSQTGNANMLKNFTLNRSGAVVNLAAALSIAAGGTVTVTDGTLVSNGNLTLNSTESNTARIAQLGSTGNITGNVTVQRFLKGGVITQRGWRMMSSPVNVFTYDQLTDDILTSGPGGATNGFDIKGNNSSIRYFDESASRGWKSIAKTSDTLLAGSGSLVFFRGDRSQTTSLTDNTIVPNHVVADFTGTINKGTINVPLSYYNSGTAADDGFNLVGNPYPSEIAWNNITKTAGVDVSFWVTDPSSGNYVARTGNVEIASGQGFFVQVNQAAQSLTFEESAKSSGNPNAYFKTASQPLTIKMFADSTRYDVAWLSFESQASENYVFKEDARKMTNPVYNLCFITPDNQLVQRNVSASPGNTNDTFTLMVSSVQNGSYTLSFEGLESTSSEKNKYLVDRYLNTITDLSSSSTYPFQVNTAVPGSSGNRFLLVFETNGNNLPVKFIDFKGVAGKQQHEFSLSVAQEKNIMAYELLRSENGHHFEPVSLFKATNAPVAHTYRVFDAAPLLHQAYYKIKATSVDGSTSFSNLILLGALSGNNQAINIFPNPASEFISVTAKEFKQLVIRSEQGQIVTISHYPEKVSVKHLEKGLYFMEVMCENGTSIMKFIKK